MTCRRPAPRSRSFPRHPAPRRAHRGIPESDRLEVRQGETSLQRAGPTRVLGWAPSPRVSSEQHKCCFWAQVLFWGTSVVFGHKCCFLFCRQDSVAVEQFCRWVAATGRATGMKFTTPAGRCQKHATVGQRGFIPEPKRLRHVLHDDGSRHSGNPMIER